MGNVFTKLIDANTTIPTKKSQVFSTAIGEFISIYKLLLIFILWIIIEMPDIVIPCKFKYKRELFFSPH